MEKFIDKLCDYDGWDNHLEKMAEDYYFNHYEKPKVYCKECKFYAPFRWGDCKYLLGKQSTPIKKGEKIFAKSDRENANNDCKFFKMK